MKKSLLFLIATTGTTLMSADFYFTGENETGSGDISVAANWDKEEIPSAEDTAIFNKSGELTSTSDLSVLFCKFHGTGLEWVLTNAVIKTTYTSSSMAFGVGAGSQTQQLSGNKFTVAKGGYIEVPLGSFRIGNVSSALTTGSTGGNTFIIEDGGRVLSRYDFTLGGSYSPTNTLIVKKGGVLDCTWNVNNFRYAGFGVSSYGNKTELYGTCVSTQNYIQVSVGIDASASNNVFTCYDGSYFNTKGNIYIGWDGSNNKLLIKDGAEFRQSNGNSRYVYVGHGVNASNNQIVVENATNMTLSAPIYIGVSGSDNSLIVTNNRIFKCQLGVYGSAKRNLYHWYGNGHTVSNINLGDIDFGAGTNNEARIENINIESYINTPLITGSGIIINKGSNNRIVFTNSSLKTCGQIYSTAGMSISGNEIIFDNSSWSHVYNKNAHAWWNDHVNFVFRNNSIGNFTQDDFSLGRDTEYASNTLKIFSGSTVSFSNFQLKRCSNVITISNATMNVNGCYMPYYKSTAGYDGIHTNNVFRFEGEEPELLSSGTLTFHSAKEEGVYEYGKTTLEFVLPRTAYAEAPIRVASLAIQGGNKIKITAPSKQYESVSYVLAETTTGAIAVADMADLASELPDNCTLRLSEDSKQLILRVSNPNGLKVIIK